MWLDMPEAGPSRPYKRTERARVAAWERQRKLEERVEKRGRWDKARRQAAEASMASASVSTVEGMRVAAITSSAAGSSSDSFIGSAMTAPTASSSTSPASGTALSEAFQPSSSTDAAVSSTSSSGFAQTTARNPDTPPPSRTFYTYSRTQPVATPTFVPGVTFDLKMAGELADEAVYAVEVDFGHGAGVTRRQIGKGSIGEVKRQGQGPAVVQKMMLQVDLGSSDMWVATTGCMSADCRAANLFDPRASIGSGVGTNLTYHSGSVSGEIMWEAVTLSTFSIAYQAFVAGASVVNQNLDGGEYSGILGLALPANSIILDEIPGTTSNDPDGAIFLDNLFGSGIYAPTQRIFSLALERREDVRTRSFLTLGSVDDKYCPSPCEPKYLPIIAQPSLGATGYLHWRISLQGIRATKWADQADGQGPDVQTIQLGPSIAVPSRSQPLAVLDSGGVAILVGNQAYADAIYAPWGITAGPDGLYRLPCKTQIALSFDFGGQWFDVHPLDLSWPDPTDPSQLTCIGAVQYTNQLGSRGDFVLGSAFLKNVYSIFSYPDPTARGTWQPAVGLYSLTNGSRASQDFYAVRYNRQSLSSVSANGPDMGGTSSTSPSAGSPGSEHGGSVMNTTAIVAGSVVGFFGIAAVLFCGWWFWLRHKYGDDGKVEYKEAPERKSVASTEDASSTRRRHRKHESAQRQRSMIDGYKDGFDDGASWTENGDSIRMAQLGEVPEEDEHTSQTQHTPRTETAAQLVDTSYAHSTPTMKLVDLVDPPMMTDGAIALPLTPVQLARQHSAVPSYISTFGDDLPATPGSTRPLLGQSPGLGTPEVVYNALTPPVAPVPPTRSNAARRTSTSPQRDFGFSLATAVPRSASMNMSGPFPSPLPVNSPGIAGGAGGQAGSGRRPSANESTTSRPQRNSMRHPENSPMYDIQTGDYFDVKAAEPGWRRRGRSGDRGGEV